MLAKLDDSEFAIRVPIAFESFEDIDTTGNSFAPHVKRSFFPEAKVASHKDVFRLL